MNEELPLDAPAQDPIREWERESHLPIPGLEKKEEE
jgi:hypothetical protein